jgi:fibronectin type 3 domain-containing protein
LRLALVSAFLIVVLAGAAPAANGPGLVAAYSFDDGSGTTLSDASGNGHNGTVSGATWAAGHDGGALSFDGSSASVDLGGLGTFYQSGFTLEAWVKKSGAKKDVAVVGSWNGGGPMLWVDHIAGDYQLVMNSGMSNYLDSGQAPVAGQWQNLAATYDGSTARYYIDGTQVASRSVSFPIGSSNVWRIGAYGSPAGGFFDGLVDDVRIYSRALSGAEVQTDMNDPVTNPSPPAGPTEPASLAVTDRSQTSISAHWEASSGPNGVAGYHVYLDGAPVDTVTGTSYTFDGLSCGTSHQLGVEAFDSAGNSSPRATLGASTDLCAAPSGLVAAYSFDDGSGTTLSDASGNGHNGTVSGATWAAGHDGGALSFDGSSASVDLGGLGTFYQSGFTLEAWVKKSGAKKDVAVVGSWNGGGPMLWVDHIAGDYQLVMNSGMSNYLDSGQAPVAGQWQNLAATYDGSTARYYIDGTQVASRSVSFPIGSSNVWRIGAYGSPAGGFFDGLVDDVRIYSRALSGAEVQTDMNLPVPAPDDDATPPTAPGNLTATVGSSSVALAWGASTDNRGVVRYDVYRGTSPGFTPSAANRIAQPTGTSYTDGGLAAGVYYYKVAAEDAAGNVGAASNEVNVVLDSTPPSAPGTLTASGAVGHASLGWAAATDNVGVARYDVYRSTTSGFTPGAANRIAQPTGTSYDDLGLAAGTYYYRVAAEDLAGNLGPASNQASATVTVDSTPPSVALTSPSAGTVSGVQAVSANASAGQGVAGVQFKLDGQNLGAEDTAGPYSVSWDTRGELNGSHALTAVARDTTGAQATSAPIAVTVNNTGVSTAGLQAAYNFDNGPVGSAFVDSSGNFRTATLVSGDWTSAGRYGGAVSLNGVNGEVDPPALGTFYKTGFTLEAWVDKQTSKVDTGIVGTWNGNQNGGPMLWVDHISGHYRLTLGSSFSNYLDSGRSPAIGQWQHVAATYDGTTARIYVDGTLAASSTFAGNVGDSNNWRIGAYGSPAGNFFDGSIDDVRIYSRALSASEIQTDMASRIQPDLTAPTVTSLTPADGSAGLNVGTPVTAKFSRQMQGSTLSSSTFTLKTLGGSVVPASVTFDQSTNSATLTPQVALGYGVTYRATLMAGGPKDLAGNGLASDVQTTFTTEASPPPILVVSSAANPFGSYLTEILRNEGLDAFTTLDTSLLSSSVLANFDLVLLGDTSLSASQVSTLTSWVNGGGKLVAMHPDKQLAGLLGLSDAGATLSNAYLKVNTASGPGVGITDQTIQYHGSADRYTLNGASALATLYSTATTATSNPAVTLRSVGSAGGQAAAFAYDLARSVVYTRQGNPAWAGQERDGVLGIRPDDLFFGAKSGDVQPDWLDTSKVAIPQADEQQRLLANLITQMESSKMPLPHFWYLPRGEKAAVVMSGDDHSPDFTPGGTASIFDRFEQQSPPGCVVALWQCVRATSYIFPDGTLTNAQAATYQAAGFEVALHPLIEPCQSTSWSYAALSAVFDAQLGQFRQAYPGVSAPATSRTHCVYWPDWASAPKVEAAHGIRMDANYYQYPGSWIGQSPGFMTGGGFPMRFADLDGSQIDVYQEDTNINDESDPPMPSMINTLLDNALGPLGYYGAFGINIHTDFPAPNQSDDAIVASAQARGVPIISYKQLLTWTDGRNASTIRSLHWSNGSLTFSTTVGAGATGLQTMLPTHGPGGSNLFLITNGGSFVDYDVETIKGIQYAVFAAGSGTYRAFYF